MPFRISIAASRDELALIRMHTRPAIPADFSAIADISVVAFANDELYYYTNPSKDLYPEDFRYLFIRRTHLRYWTPGFVFHVAVTDEGDEGHDPGGKTVGFSCWMRVGEGSQKNGTERWIADSLRGVTERNLAYLRDKYITFFKHDRSLDQWRLSNWLAQQSENFDKIPAMWKLQNLCVDPMFQRRGIGRLLMQWGKKRAQEEGIPVGCSSSEMGAGLYLREGFKRWGTMRVEGLGMGDVPVFLFEPEGTEGRFEGVGDIEARKEDQGGHGVFQAEEAGMSRK